MMILLNLPPITQTKTSTEQGCIRREKLLLRQVLKLDEARVLEEWVSAAIFWCLYRIIADQQL